MTDPRHARAIEAPAEPDVLALMLTYIKASDRAIVAQYECIEEVMDLIPPLRLLAMREAMQEFNAIVQVISNVLERKAKAVPRC